MILILIITQQNFPPKNQNELLATIKLEEKENLIATINFLRPPSPLLFSHSLFLCPPPLPTNKQRKYV